MIHLTITLKKIIINTLLVILLINFSNLTAQNFNFGLKFGYNISEYKVKSPLSSGYEKEIFNGLVLGFQSEIGISKNFSLAPQLLLTSVLTKNEVSSELHHFVLLPIIGKYNISNKFAFLFGPQLNYTISKPNKSINKLNYALNIGLSYDFTDRISLQTNYAVGLNSTVKIKDYIAKYNHLTFTLGYYFIK